MGVGSGPTNGMKGKAGGGQRECPLWSGSARPRVVLALGGNALANRNDELEFVEHAMEMVADVIAAGYEVVLTHGNGPQIGNLVTAADLAAHAVPAQPMDVCVAQTQASIGYRMMVALEAALAVRGEDRGVATVLTRVCVDERDPAWTNPTKPIGAFLSTPDAKARRAAGQCCKRIDGRGWRRVVPSPQPKKILEAASIRHLVAEGTIVIAAGGGGIPVVNDGEGVRGVEAVVDKDLTSELLAEIIGARMLVIATDVEHVYLRYRDQSSEPLTNVTARQLRQYAAEGEFSAGSMGPKVEAAARFVEHGGECAVIASMDRLKDAVRGRAGTVVTLGHAAKNQSTISIAE
ncbi:MAG: carbamate kinase [Actinomycetota bacterium]